MKWLKRIGLQLGVTVVALALLFTVGAPVLQNLAGQSEVAQKALVTIGFAGEAYAVTPDYQVDGVADDVQVQQALNALPPTGGRLVLFAGNYVFAATVSRAINNVTIEGDGKGTYIAWNATTPLFSAGTQTGWVFKDFQTDGGYLTLATSTIVSRVWNVSVLGGTGAPFTYTVVGNNSTASQKAAANYICDGTADQTEINAAIDAVRDSGIPGSVRLIGVFNLTGTVDMTLLQIPTSTAANDYAAAFTLDMQNAIIYANINNLPVFDLTGAQFITVLGGNIETGANHPSCAFLLARAAVDSHGYANNTAGNHKFYDTRIYGDFQTAAIYNYGSESNNYFGLEVSNTHAGASCLNYNSSNPSSLTSAFTTISSGNVSTSYLGIYGGEWFYSGGAAGNVFYIMGWSGSPSVSFFVQGSHVGGNGYATFYFNMTNGNYGNVNISGVAMTDLIPNYAIYVANAGGARTLSTVSVVGSTLSATVNEIKIDTNSTADNWVVDRTNYYANNLGDSGTFTNSIQKQHDPVDTVRVSSSVNISTNNATWTYLSFDTEEYDTNAMHSGGSPTRLTANVTGYYLIVGTIVWASHATGLRYLQLRGSGGTFYAGPNLTLNAVNGDSTVNNISATYYLTAGQYIEMGAYQTSGGALNVLGGGPQYTNLAMTLLRQ